MDVGYRKQDMATYLLNNNLSLCKRERNSKKTQGQGVLIVALLTCMCTMVPPSKLDSSSIVSTAASCLPSTGAFGFGLKRSSASIAFLSRTESGHESMPLTYHVQL